ncbi:anti-sigma-D factor RsdA [Nocardia sp. NPDC005366]|uniref:anti-sigma-D factor RsdA n=1 Tax=Nocardia sp. NPDC005366 TaxID=3156878 RepID=UPI0033A6B40B
MARDGERGRGDWKARRGSRNSGPYAGASGDSGPVDIAAVRWDDALIDAISHGGPVQTDSTEEFQLAALLADWRAEIIVPPLPSAPDLDVVAAAVNQEIGARKVRVGAQANGRLRLVRPILGTAAALALVIGGLTAFSYNAEPGNPLWRVKEVVFSEQAQTTVVNRADSQLDQAEQALAQHNPSSAKAQLEAALANVDQVSDPVKRAQLQTQWAQLLETLRKDSPALAEQIESITKPAEPKPTTGPGSNTPSTPGQSGQQPASQTTPNNTIMQVPVETSEPKPPTATQPTAPTQQEPPSVTTVPQATQEPPTQASPTQEPPTQAQQPTQEPSTAAPTGGGQIPTQPSNLTPNPGITIPTLPFTLPGRPTS